MQPGEDDYSYSRLPRGFGRSMRIKEISVLRIFFYEVKKTREEQYGARFGEMKRQDRRKNHFYRVFRTRKNSQVVFLILMYVLLINKRNVNNWCDL